MITQVRRALATVFSLGIAAIFIGPEIAPAHAETDPIVAAGNLLGHATAPDGSTIVSADLLDDNRTIVMAVHSAAMDKDITVIAKRPADPSAPRPVLYLLNGAGGGEDTATWKKNTDALEFLATKNVNVIQVIGGAWSYYTDWRAPDPVLGVNKWKTFFTEELPPLIDTALGANGINAIAGLSTSGTSVLALPIAKPGLYRAVAAYSGCAQISDPAGYNFVNLAVHEWGGGDTVNMYGPKGDPMWVENDPYVNANKLRGLELFISSGTGLPGKHDTVDSPFVLSNLGALANQVAVGGIIESATDWCTHNMQDRLETLDIPATFNFPGAGTHSWGYWQDALHKSWSVLAKGLELTD
ncbi:alpha/beta hydrolase family protein [Nocardia sp. NPDC051030]|uniref:alpha/beta hydrolase n=1 Tax=Nocardia sp. NPDC051030 TaxID=3155162 RepID=UPI003420425B